MEPRGDDHLQKEVLNRILKNRGNLAENRKLNEPIEKSASTYRIIASVVTFFLVVPITIVFFPKLELLFIPLLFSLLIVHLHLGSREVYYGFGLSLVSLAGSRFLLSPAGLLWPWVNVAPGVDQNRFMRLHEQNQLLLTDGPRFLLTIIFAALMTSLLVHGWRYLIRNKGLPENWLHYFFVALIVLNFSILSYQNLKVASYAEPVMEEYKYDGYIFLKTFYLMKAGDSYYKAQKISFEGDERIESFEKFMPSATYLRQPGVFLLWRYTAANGRQIAILSSILALAAVVLLSFSLNHQAGSAGALASSLAALLLIPYIYIASSWANIFLPDWWAMLFVLFSFSMLMRDNYAAAASFALVAVLFRETTVFLLLGAIIAGIIYKKKYLSIYFSGAITVFLALFAWHFHLGSKMLPETKSTVVGMFLKDSLDFSYLTNMTSYLIYPYRFNIIPPALIVLAGLIGVFFIRHQITRLCMFIYVFGYLTYGVFMPASPYWGQMILPLIIMSFPMILDRPVLRQIESR